MMRILKTGQAAPPDYIVEAALDVWRQTGEQHLISTTGRSMLPLIQEGDQVLVTHGCESVQRGDVVVFRQKGQLIAHRVMRIQSRENGPAFVTRGDNVLCSDPPVNADKVMGRVLAIKRHGRLMALNTPFWYIVGRVVAVGTLPVMGLCDWGRNLKHHLWGTAPHPLTNLMRRSILIPFSIALRIAQIMSDRWKNN